MRPAVVLFDLDDTLFKHREAVDIGATTALRRLDEAITDEEIADELRRWRNLEERHYHRYLSREIGFEDQRRARARDFTGPYGLDLLDDAAASDWWSQYAEGYRDAWLLHDDALPCLDELADRFHGVRFGLITNGELDFQMTKIDAVELTERMEHIVASGEFGTAKPDPAIFRHACSLFDAAPEQCVYVGDRFRTDAVGAAAAGLTGVWLNRLDVVLGPEDDQDLALVTVISALGELPRVLAEL